jgi:hypothetical protein
MTSDKEQNVCKELALKTTNWFAKVGLMPPQF